MKSVEILAKSIDEAITKGCEELGVDISEVDFDILEEAGLFRKMKVKISLKKSDEPAPVKEIADEPVKEEEVKTSDVEEFEMGGAVKSEKPKKERVERPVTEFDEKCPKFVKTLEFATKFFAEMDSSLKITTSHNDREFIISVDGEEVSRLIGKEGKTLAAINTLVSSVAISNSNGEPRRVIVDIANYREKRKESLIALAKRKAEYVKESGKAVKLEPMPARERVVVHMTLQDIEGIITQSEGNEPHRYLVIKPGAR